MNYYLAALSSPGPVIFNLGPITLRWYGLLIALSVLIGLYLSGYLAKVRGLNNDFINDLLPILVLSSVIGARIYYVAFEWENYKYNPVDALAIWQGGIAIHGALISGTFAVWIFCRLRKLETLEVLDILLPSVCLGQAIGRWGNFFNNEAFGIPTELPWKLSIPYIYRPQEFINYEHFHPTFLYESIWNVAVFILLLVLFSLGKSRFIRLPTGALTCFYMIAYSMGRFWIEGLRIDPLCIGGVAPFCEGGIRTAQLISLVFIILGLICLYFRYSLGTEFTTNKRLNKGSQP